MNRPAIGTAIYNHNKGYIYEIEDTQNRELFLIGASMEKIEYNAKIIYLKHGKGNSIGSIENLSLEGILDLDAEPATKEQLAIYLKEAEEKKADEQRLYNQKVNRQKEARQAFEDEHAGKIPVWAKAVIVASYDNDECDSQTDYFHSSVSKSVILGFSKHTRDLFSEMRKHAAKFEPLAEIIEAGKGSEHREKYSMGAGYYLKNGSSWCTGWRIHKVHLNDDSAIRSLPMGEWLADDQPKKQATSAPIQQGEGFTLSDGTREGFTQIAFEGKPSEEIRTELKTAKFRWSRHNKVWYGKTDALPAQYKDTSEATSEDTSANPLAAQLRQLADDMEKAIDSKLNPATAGQNPTHRRAMIIEGMRSDGEKLQKIQHILKGLADGHESATLPAILSQINSKAAIESILLAARIDSSNIAEFYPDDAKRLARLGINTADDYKRAVIALAALVEGAPKEDDTIQQIRKLENELIGCKIDGFFPTPNGVIDQIIERTYLDGKKVLEPSAGNGAIAERLRAEGASVDVIEINGRLQDILKLKGFNLVDNDFLQFNDGYDLIIQNPPFEALADIDHVQHALSILNDGGRLISIMGEGVFFRDCAKAQNFRNYLDRLGAEVIELKDAFKEKGAGRIRTTGVLSRLVIIDKP